MSTPSEHTAAEASNGAAAPIYGVMAEFETADGVLAAAKKVRAAGYTKTDAFSPFPVHGLHEALTERRTRLPRLVLLAGLVGAVTGFALQYYLIGIDYPLNVGGRPLLSWPAFMPITFELTILFAAFAAVLGLFAANRFPELYHPVFNAPHFARASQDRFFLCIESDDAQYDAEATRRFLERDLDPAPTHVSDVSY